MKNIKTYTWYLVFYFLPVFAVACGGRVEYDVRGDNGSDPGATPTAPPVDFPSDPVSSDPPPFTGNDGGIAGSSGSGGSAGSIATGGSSGSSGSGGSVATGGSSGEAGEAGTPADGGVDVDASTLATLNIALAADTPPGMTMCITVTEQQVLNFTIKAGSQDVWAETFRIHHVGTGSAGEITALRLEFSHVFYAGVLVDAMNGVWEFSTPGVFVAAGSTVEPILHATFNGTMGAQHAFEVQNASAVTTITPAIVTGSFPVRGNTFTLTDNVAACQTVKLRVESGGPPAGTALGGAWQQTMLKIQLTALVDDLDIKKLPITLECDGGGMVKGSNGTPYFTSIAVKSPTMQAMLTRMGPIELPASTPNGATSADLEFTDSWTLTNGTSVDIVITMNIANQEDAPGEFFGHQCRVTLKSLAGQNVKDLVYGFMLSAPEIDVNTDIVGSWVAIQQASLMVDLAPIPVSSTHVKKEQNVPTVGLTFTTGAKGVTVSQLTLQGQADRGSGFGTAQARSDLAKNVTVECLYDGLTQIGLCMTPNSVDGTTVFTDLNLSIPANSSKTLTVKTSLASTIGNPAGDKVAIGIGGTDAIAATDSDGTSVFATVSANVYGQVTSLSPIIVQTILNSGTLTIVNDSHPASAIVVGGKDSWVPFARYKATAQYESAKIDRLRANLESGLNGRCVGADFVAVAVASGGVVHGQDVFPTNSPPAERDIDLSSNPISVPKDGSVVFELWGKTAATISSSAALPTSPKSGDTCSMSLMHDQLNGEWDANYAGMVNVRTTGNVSGERLYAASSGATVGNPMVLRKSKPTVTRIPLASNALANVDMDLHKFQISADAAGPIEFAQFALQFEKSSEIAITGLGIRKGYTELMSGNEVWVLTDNLSGLAAGGTGAKVTFQLLPETIVGSGAVFTVHATLQGVATGKHVTVSFDRVDGASLPMTGKQESPASGPGIHLVPFTNATFIWSDLSEVPHGWDSLDWTNDLYVQDLTQSQALYAP